MVYGNDCLYLGYRLTDYRLRNEPNLRVYGLVAKQASPGQPAALVWIKNEHYTWYNSNQGEQLDTIPPTHVTLAGLADGEYEIQWLDTYTGRWTHRDDANAQDGRLVLPVAALSKDIACRVMRK